MIDKEKSRASKLESSAENATRMIYEIFILELYFETFHFGISIVLLVEIKYMDFFQITCFKEGKSMAFEKTSG